VVAVKALSIALYTVRARYPDSRMWLRVSKHDS